MTMMPSTAASIDRAPAGVGNAQRIDRRALNREARSSPTVYLFAEARQNGQPLPVGRRVAVGGE